GPHRDVHVVRTVRVGDNIEDITFVGAGKHKGRVAMMNGWDVMAVKVNGDQNADGNREAVQKLFDVRGLGLGSAVPRGIEFVPTHRRFYITGSTVGQQARPFVTDEDGRPLPPPPITYPGGLDPFSDIVQFEGLGYIPSTSSIFPDHLLALTARFPDFTSVIEII